MYQLRDYQTAAVKAAFEWIKKNRSPCLLELATGAGKSLICAELALLTVMQSGKKALCLCPTAELVEQNSEKYALTGEKFSIYSASISKSLVHNAVFATEGTFKSVAEEQGDKFSLVIIDEAHRITPTIKKIIEDMKKRNPNLRVIGMTGTPYRLGTGYIYEQDENGSQMEDARDCYFKRLVYKVGGALLVERGYITKPVVGKAGVEGYNTDGLKLGRTNNFSAEDLDQAFCGHGKKTAAIVADVINQANAMQARGIMFFAATVRHAEEIMASLPAYNSALVTGDTKKKERKRIIREYKAQRIKYLVNVAVLTTGFDAPHTDLVAILRATESAALLTQIIGRGLRLFEGKEFCLILDYAGNIEKFFPDKDLFNPKIKAFGEKPAIKDEFICEKCNFPSTFTLRPNPDGYDIDQFGYFKDGAGDRIVFEGMGFPAHYGRRCTHLHRVGHDQFERCDYFWSFKKCHECEAENDIAARVCGDCGSQLIDPNDKLALDFSKFKNDLSQLQTDKIVSVIKKRPRLGLILWIVETEHRKIEVFFSQKVNKKFYDIVNDRGFMPKTISYKQNSGKYFIISDFNRPEDKP